LLIRVRLHNRLEGGEDDKTRYTESKIIKVLNEIGKGMVFVKFATIGNEIILASGAFKSSQLLLSLFFREYLIDEHF